MGSQVLIQPKLAAETSEFIEIFQRMLPATLQSNGLAGGEKVAVFSTDGTDKFGKGVLTLTANVVDTETVTIDGKVYTFQTVLTNVDGNVLIGATASDSIDNLIAAINKAAGAGTLYAALTTQHPTVTVSAGAGDTMDAIAKLPGAAGNVATTEGLISGSWSNATLVGGGASFSIEVSEGGTAVELNATNNRIAINSPIKIQVAKDITIAEVGVTLAYENQV